MRDRAEPEVPRRPGAGARNESSRRGTAAPGLRSEKRAGRKGAVAPGLRSEERATREGGSEGDGEVGGALEASKKHSGNGYR